MRKHFQVFVLEAAVSSPYGPGRTQFYSNGLSTDSTHPGTAAALAYINKNLNLDSCGQQTKAYIDSIMAGNSREVASQAATAVYQQNHMRGVPLSAACLAAEVAWKNAVAGGQDPVLPASLAYMEASPSNSPCYVSGKKYIQVTPQYLQMPESKVYQICFYF